MAPSEKSLANLKRGGIKGTAEGAARARAAKLANDAETARLGDLAGSDPYAAYDEMHATMTRHTLKLLRAEERSGGKPSRDVTDRLREYRQLTEALAAYRGSRETLVEWEQFFAGVDQRVARAIERFGPPQLPAPLPAPLPD